MWIIEVGGGLTGRAPYKEELRFVESDASESEVRHLTACANAKAIREKRRSTHYRYRQDS